MSTNSVCISKERATWYRLSPLQGLTLDEIASILHALAISVDESVYKTLQPSVQKHFRKVEEE